MLVVGTMIYSRGDELAARKVRMHLENRMVCQVKFLLGLRAIALAFECAQGAWLWHKMHVPL